jgi:hypothetical protein
MRIPLATLPATLLAVAFASLAQMPTAFPPDTEAVTAELFEQRFAGRSLEGVRADGTSFRIDPGKDGSYAEMSRGNSANGKWRIDDGKFCTELYRASSGCNEVRAQGEVLYYKRISNGEVVALRLR